MKVAIIRGSRKALKEFGMESMIADARLVIETPGPKRVYSDFGETYDVTHVAVDTPEATLVECMDMIRSAWESANPDEAHLGHAACGLWWFYWTDSKMRRVAELTVGGDSESIRASARDYINAEFGAKRGPTLALQEA
jgi:hypothetical protein